MFILYNFNPLKYIKISFLLSASIRYQFSCSVMSDSLPPRESQHARPPCPSPTPGVYPNPCPLSRWCLPAISFSVVPFFSCPQYVPAIRVFSNESAFLMRWQKYQSFIFNISPSSEHSGLISFRMDWLDLLAVQGTLESSPTPQFKGVQFSLSASSMHSTHWNFLVYRQVI